MQALVSVTDAFEREALPLGAGKSRRLHSFQRAHTRRKGSAAAALAALLLLGSGFAHLMASDRIRAHADEGLPSVQVSAAAPAAAAVPFILGSSVYQMLDFPVEDIAWYIHQLAAAGGSAFEVFLHRSWPARLEDRYSIGAQSSIYKRIGVTKDPRFPGFKFPLFDLDQWDEANLSKLETIYQLAADAGLKVIIRIHDQFSRKSALYKKCYPYDACLQAEGYAGGPGSAWLLDESETNLGGRPPARTFLRRENDKLLELARASGADVYYCLMSEADYAKTGEVTAEEIKRRFIVFHEFYYDELTAKGVAPDHIIVSFKRAMDVMRVAPRWQNSIFEVHGCNSPQVLQKYYALYGVKNLFPNGDGPDPNAQGLFGTIGYVTREPSPNQARQMRALIIANGGWGWCTWNRNVEKRWPARMRRADFQIIKALAGLI